MSQLFLVPTPIGNLDDMTFRAINVLKDVDVILAEDTRVSRKLLSYFQIDTPMKSYHMHNEHRLTEQLVDQILSGTSLALISDAGTPGISDPGFLLVRSCLERGIKVECLPGATAFVPALVCSGLENNRFVFEGFLPDKKGRASRLNELKEMPKTMVFYVSPYKLIKTLNDFKTCFGGDRLLSISRELTKIHEEHQRGTINQMLEVFENRPSIKGEFVVVVQGSKSKSS